MKKRKTESTFEGNKTIPVDLEPFTLDDLVEDCDRCGGPNCGASIDVNTGSTTGFNELKATGDSETPSRVPCPKCKGSGRLLTDAGLALKLFVEEYVLDDD